MKSTTMTTTVMMLVTVTILLMMATAVQSDVMCSAMSSRSSTSVTCFFGIDVNNTDKSFNVQYYASPTDPRESLLMCNRDQDKKLKCQNSTGHRFNGAVNEKVTIQNTPALNSAGGRVACELLQSSLKVHMCPVMYVEDPKTVVVPSVSPPGKNLESETDGATVGRQKAMLGLLSFFFLALIAILLILFLCHERVLALRPKCFYGPTSPEDPEAPQEKSSPDNAKNSPSDVNMVTSEGDNSALKPLLSDDPISQTKAQAPAPTSSMAPTNQAQAQASAPKSSQAPQPSMDEVFVDAKDPQEQAEITVRTVKEAKQMEKKLVDDAKAEAKRRISEAKNEGKSKKEIKEIEAEEKKKVEDAKAKGRQIVEQAKLEQSRKTTTSV